jgi:hypothetical protein
MKGWCVLRAGGARFAPSEFLAAFPLPGAHVRGTSLNVTIGDSDATDLAGQIKDATLFLKTNRPAVKALVLRPGVGVSLDFGLLLKETYTQSVSFPPVLTKLAGELGIGLDATFYSPDL